MLTEYIKTAMGRARYEILDDGTFYGEIQGFRGVWADADTLESCRRELQEVLEDWIVISLQLDNKLPRLPGVKPFPKPSRIAS